MVFFNYKIFFIPWYFKLLYWLVLWYSIIGIVVISWYYGILNHYIAWYDTENNYIIGIVVLGIMVLRITKTNTLYKPCCPKQNLFGTEYIPLYCSKL